MLQTHKLTLLIIKEAQAHYNVETILEIYKPYNTNQINIWI